MKPKPKDCNLPGDHDATACVALGIALLLVTVIALSLGGCAGTPNVSILPGSDNITVTATVVPEGETLQELLPYAALANEGAASAIQLYMATQDSTTLQKLLYWTAYASGIAAKLEAISSGR